ncbi:MAG: 3-keto-5-aminohexanoate cleavage protein [Solirubrobacterales bacterium]
MTGAEPLIVNLAPTGMVPSKEMTPPRDQAGVPTHRAECFAPLIEGIRMIDRELIVCATCSGRLVSDVDSRAEVLTLQGDAKPDMASLTLGSNNFRMRYALPLISCPSLAVTTTAGRRLG